MPPPPPPEMKPTLLDRVLFARKPADNVFVLQYVIAELYMYVILHCVCMCTRFCKCYTHTHTHTHTHTQIVRRTLGRPEELEVIEKLNQSQSNK